MSYLGGRVVRFDSEGNKVMDVDYDEYDALKKPQTNADRIRQMSDEELAEWFIKIQDDTADYIDGQYFRSLPATSESWALWLKSHADKEESQ